MEMKFRAHDTFFIRKGWISKGMRHVKSNPEVFISKKENPMDVLGIGANMVKALRYWLQAVGVTKEPSTGKRFQEFTEFGSLIYANDQYIEELGTLYLLHYKLVSKPEMATSWYYFFNEFSLSDFTRDEFASQITNFIRMQADTEGKKEVTVAPRSIEDDFNCIINTYVPRYKLMPNKVSAENNIDCPLGELGLVDIIRKDKGGAVYKKVVPASATLNPWVVLAVIFDNANGRSEIGLSELLTKQGNIGKVFNLDSIAMLDVLRKAEGTGELKIIRTAGLDIINLYNQRSFEECVKRYYQNIALE